MKFVEEVFVADRILVNPNPAGPLPYPFPGAVDAQTYGINLIHPINRTMLATGGPLIASDPVKVMHTVPEPVTYWEAAEGAVPVVGWKTSNKIFATYVKRIQGFPYYPSTPMILEFIPRMPANQVLDPGIFFQFTIRDTKADLWEVHNQRRPYIAGPRGAVGYTLAQALNDIIEQVNNDSRNGVMAYPFAYDVVGRYNLPFGSPLTNAIRFVAAVKRVAPHGGPILQANYDFQKRFELAFEVKTANDLPVNQILPLVVNEIYPIAPPDLNYANHVAFVGYPQNPIWYQCGYGSGNQWQVRMHEEKARGYTGDLYRHFQVNEVMHTNRAYVSDALYARYGGATFYDKIIIEHDHPELRESYSLRNDPIQTTIYFAKCPTPYSLVPPAFTLYDHYGNPSGEPELSAITGDLFGYANINVFGLYNRIQFFTGGQGLLETYPDLPPNNPDTLLGFGQMLDGQIPGNILASPPINQLGNPLNGVAGFPPHLFNLTINAMLQNEICLPRYGVAAPNETPYQFYVRISGWASTQAHLPGANYNIM
jgi:hypothetical protein